MTPAWRQSAYPAYRQLQTAASMAWISPDDADYRTKAKDAADLARQVIAHRHEAGNLSDLDGSISTVCDMVDALYDAGARLDPDHLGAAITAAAPLLRAAEEAAGRPVTVDSRRSADPEHIPPKQWWQDDD